MALGKEIQAGVNGALKAFTMCSLDKNSGYRGGGGKKWLNS